MSEIRVLGVLVKEPGKAAIEVQRILTKYGCSIRTRLGLNELEKESCAGCGLILLELMGNPDESIRLENELLEVEDVVVRKMVF
ncbi:MAG: hypothetical protein R6U86_04315 [Bacteroidales bacterium]